MMEIWAQKCQIFGKMTCLERCVGHAILRQSPHNVFNNFSKQKSRRK